MATTLALDWAVNLVGVDTGQSIQSTVGEDFHIDFTVVGTAVNVTTWQFQTSIYPSVDSYAYKTWSGSSFGSKTSGGSFRLTGVAADTETLPGRNYYIETRRVDSGFNTILSKGFWTLSPSNFFTPVVPMPPGITFDLTDTTNFLRHDGQWAAGAGGGGGGGSGTWGGIIGTLSDQTDLQAELDALQPLDANLTALSGLTFTTNTFPAQASTGPLSAKAITDFALSLLTDANQAQMRTRLALTPGTDVQAFDVQLASIAGLTYPGNAFKGLRVNAAETGFELAVVAGAGDALTAAPLSQFAATTSAQLAGVLSDETGYSTGAFAVFSIGPTIAGATITGRTQLAAVDYGTIADDGNSGTSKTIDFSAKNIRKVRLTGSCTFTFTPPAGATTILLKLTADGTGAYTSTWPGTVVWNGGSAPDNLTANEVQWIGGTYDGTNYYLDYSPTSATTSKVSVANEASDATCFLGFVTSATGLQGLKTNAALPFNSATGVLTLTSPIFITPALGVVASGDITACTGTLTIRLKRRIGSTTSSATPSINSDLYDTYKLTAQAVNITSVTVTGTPNDDQNLKVIITTTGTITIALGSSFEASSLALPTGITGVATVEYGFRWNVDTSKWRIIAQT